MRYLLIALILLSGCSTVEVQPKGVDFLCAAMSAHGVYARWRGTYVTQSSAEADAKIITDRLVEKKLIPDSAFPVCNLDR